MSFALSSGDLTFTFETSRHQELCDLLSKKPPVPAPRRGSATASLQTIVPIPADIPSSPGYNIAAQRALDRSTKQRSPSASSLDSGLGHGEPYDRLEEKSPLATTPNLPNFQSDSYFDDLKRKYKRIQVESRIAEGDPGRKKDEHDPEYMVMQPQPDEEYSDNL